MANVSKTQSYNQKPLLRFPVGLDAVKSVVLDANAFAVSTDGSRYIVPSGTILKLSATEPKRYVEYDGSGTIQGILKSNVDLLAQSTQGSEPAAMFFFGCVFATDAITKFTQYASALVADLGAYNKFE